MISFKGLVLGIVLDFVGTLFSVVAVQALIMKKFTSSFTTQGVGADINLLKTLMLHSATYWLMLLALLAAGCEAVYFMNRPTV